MKLLLTLLVLSVISLAACTTATPAFEDIEWVLESYGEKGNLQPVLENSEITATFDSIEDKVAGSAGCNRYFGGYETSRGKLTMGLIASTEMWCEGLMDQEQAYLKILGATETCQIEDGKLHVSSGDKLLIFKRK